MHFRDYLRFLLAPMAVLIFAYLASGCATMIYSQPEMNKTVALMGGLPSEGIVLESRQGAVFPHSQHKKVHTKGVGVQYTKEGSTSKTEDISETQFTSITWLGKQSSEFPMTLSSKGQPRQLSVYCNCILKDQGQRGGAGQAILSPVCKGSSKPKKAIITTEKNTLWVVLGIIPGVGIGYLVDHLTGALYDFKPLSVSQVCASKSSKKKSRK